MPVGVSAYVALANVTLGSSAANVTFSSIGQGYRDLVLVINGTASSGSGMSVTHNGDTTSGNYSSVTMFGDGSTTGSNTATNANLGALFTAPTTVIQNFMDYSATDKHKTALSRMNFPGGQVNAQARRWANTAAITSITLNLDSGVTFSVGTTFALYGIAS
jgi:hypothetical protein